MKILIIESNKSTQSILESVLNKANTKNELSFFSDFADGKEDLSKGDVDLALISLNNENITSYAKQLKSIAKKLILTKAILIIADLSISENPDYELIKNLFKTADHVTLPLSMIRLSSTIMDVLEDFHLDHIENVLYLPIKIELLKNAVSVPCDLFVKISEKKYVKIINKDQSGTVIETADKYQKKGIDVLYVEKDFYSSLSNLILNDFYCSEVDSLPVAERGIKITESIMMVTKDLGASEVIIDSINNSYTEVIKNLETEKVSKLLASLTLGENLFIENHSYLTSVFAVMMVRKMDWNTSKIQNNLCMAALLHDLVLADNQLGHHDKDNLEEIKKLPVTERDLVLNHAKILADKLSKTTTLPSDVLSLISKHHEGRGKNSYPGLDNSGQLPPVNCLFNVSHQFSIELYKIGFNNMKLNIAFANLRECFTSSSMRTYIDLLEENVNL